MEEKKYLGMTRNVNFGLTWLCFIFGIVLLAIEHEKMDREDKLEIVSCFVCAGLWITVDIICGIVFGILGLGWIASLISAVFYIFFIVKMIMSFMGKEWKVPCAYQMAEKFVK